MICEMALANVDSLKRWLLYLQICDIGRGLPVVSTSCVYIYIVLFAVHECRAVLSPPFKVP